TGATVGTFFIPMTQISARHGQGYETHVTTGIIKAGYGTGWGEGVSGYCVGVGGNDAYPTEYFTMAYGGKITHSRGYEFFSTAFPPTATHVGLGSVSNYGKTDDVNSTATNLYATASMVSKVKALIGSADSANVSRLMSPTGAVANLNTVDRIDRAFYFRHAITSAGSTNLFPSTNNANAVLTVNTHAGAYYHQLGFSSDGKMYHRGDNTGTWGAVFTDKHRPTSAQVGLGNVPNTAHTAAATASTVVLRDGSADITTRYFKSNIANQATISGAMAFRVTNGTTDNGIRFCSDPVAIRTWLGASASGGDDTYVKKAGDTMTGKLQLNAGLNLNHTGRITFYTPAYVTWGIYMSNRVAGGSLTGATPESFGGVSTWAIRSTVESAAGYGWTWDSCANAANTVPTTRMALSSNTGTLTVSGYLSSVRYAKTTTIGSDNVTYTHYKTDANNGHHFNKNVYVTGNIYCGTSYANLVWSTANLAFGTGATNMATGNHTHTAAQVGLGNVANYGHSNAIGDNSTVRYATTNMVAQVRAEKIDKNMSGGTPAAAYLTESGVSGLGIKVRLPFNTNAGKMLTFTVRVYASYHFYDVQFSGYLYVSTNQWYDPKAKMINGTKAVTARMGRDDDGRAYVWVTGGDYCGAAVFNVTGGYSNADWNTGWSITRTDYCPTLALNITVSDCPYQVGDILTTTNSANPAVNWPGTTWRKIEGSYMRGTAGSEASKLTGGSMTKTIAIANLPAHNHSVSVSLASNGSHSHTANHNHSASQTAHSHGQPAHRHYLYANATTTPIETTYAGITNAEQTMRATHRSNWDESYNMRGTGTDATLGRTGSQGSETTGGATPGVTVSTQNVTTSSATSHSHTATASSGNNGSGTALDIQPKYYTVHVWERAS
ncbi:MAG: phage baseplate protein, partial [Fusobacteriaceae bacterium]